MNTARVEVSVALDIEQTVATVRFGRKRPIVAGVLGTECNSEGKLLKIWLDRDIHRAVRNKDFVFWKPYGAVSTILERTT